MKEAMAKEMEKEARARKRLPEDVKDKRDRSVIRNLLVACLITLLFILVNIGYFKLEKSTYIEDTAIFSMIILGISIILFEEAFSKGKGFLGLHGVEVLLVCIYIYFIPYTYYNYGEFTTKLLMLMPLVFDMYYCFKGIGICIKANKQKHGDIKEIVLKKETKEDDNTIEMDKDEEADKEEEKLEKEKVKNNKKNNVKAVKKEDKKPNVNKQEEPKKIEEKSDEPKSIEKVAVKKSTRRVKEEKPEKPAVKRTTRSTKKVTTEEVDVKEKKKETRTKKTVAKTEAKATTKTTTKATSTKATAKPKTTKATTTKTTEKPAKTTAKKTATKNTRKKKSE